MNHNTDQEEDVGDQHAWLSVGAKDKADSIEILSAGLGVKSVLEIGSGTGAILQELDRRGFATDYYCIEPSAAEYSFMIKRVEISRLRDSECAELSKSRLGGRRYDLVVLSHVLEHLMTPAVLLAGAIDLGRYVIVEVPLEGTLAGNLRARIKARFTAIPRLNNAAGHVQFLSPASARLLASFCGGRVTATRVYCPTYGERRDSYSAITSGIRHLLGTAIFARLYYGHMAMLVERRPTVPEHDRTRWPRLYHTD